MAAQLALRDVHLPASPGWWPLAPGWWIVAAVVMLVLAAFGWWVWQRRRRRQQWLALFDTSIATMKEPAQQLAAASELLRRAAPVEAQRLSGEAWLAFLNGAKAKSFSEGAGRILLEGGFQREVDAATAANACALARARFIELMAVR
jgi:hypothetical protein